MVRSYILLSEMGTKTRVRNGQKQGKASVLLANRGLGMEGKGRREGKSDVKSLGSRNHLRMETWIIKEGTKETRH